MSFLKGTDAENVRHPRFYWNVEPTVENGLDKLTAFHLVPRYFRLRRLQLYFPERHMAGWMGRPSEACVKSSPALIQRSNHAMASVLTEHVRSFGTDERSRRTGSAALERLLRYHMRLRSLFAARQVT